MMKLDLQKSALFAEIIGGIAIVVTLVILVLEIRSNTNSIQSQSYQELIFELNKTRRDYFSEEISLIFRKNREGELSENERFRFAQVMQVKWSVYEAAYFAYIFGTLNEAGWSRFEEAICRNFKLDEDLWDIDRVYAIKNTLNSEFVAYVEEDCG